MYTKKNNIIFPCTRLVKALNFFFCLVYIEILYKYLNVPMYTEKKQYFFSEFSYRKLLNMSMSM